MRVEKMLRLTNKRQFFRRNVPVWKHITRGKRLRRAFINFEYGTPYDECTPW